MYALDLFGLLIYRSKRLKGTSGLVTTFLVLAARVEFYC